MPQRGAKRKGAQYEEWNEDVFETQTLKGVKHVDEHIELTGTSSSATKVLLGPSPKKSRLPPRLPPNDSDNDISNIDSILWPGPECEAQSDSDESTNHEQDTVDPDVVLPPFNPETISENIPNLDPSPYDELWCETEPMGKSSGEGTSAKRQKKEPNANPLSSFIELIDSFVDELLRLEAPEPSQKQRLCNHCQDPLEDTHFRCRDCPSTALWCATCVVEVHRSSWLHRLEFWNGEFYDRKSLHSLGLRIQLGHTHGTKCKHPESGPSDFVIIDSDGIHDVSIDYCGCHNKASYTEQLLRARLFPASCTSPKTAATFRVLESFQMLSFTAKVSAFEFLAAIRRRTDPFNTINDRYREFLRMVHMWRHVRLLKRGGRGHDPTGVKGTKPGECALLCPACPQVGINLPDNWQDSKLLWIYALFLAIDANFRLKRKDVSTDEKDPGLNHGFAYIVAEQPFRTHLATHGDAIPDDKSTCSNHDAIKSASIRGGKGVAATGLGTCQCSRHDMKRPLGSGDLQKGERYVNMDYFFLSTLAFFIPILLVVSYDIACQWSKKLKARCIRYGSNPVEDETVEIKFAVPKFHLPAHVQVCRDNFNFNYTPHVGRTDGEAPERGWSTSNDLSYSTREMGAGTRRDTLDDAYSYTNQTKTVAMAQTLADRASEAIVQRLEHVTAFQDFAGGIDDVLVKEWTVMAQQWEKDSSLPNPFVSSGDELTEASVRSEMAEEDTKAISKGKYKKLHSDLTPSQFILQGVELEESVRKHLIAIKDLKPSTTSASRSRLIQAGNMLRRRFDSWEETQRIFMPSVFPYREEGSGDVGAAPGAATQVKDIRFLLPSDVIGVDEVDVSRSLARYEFRIRIAQAHSSIRELRGLLLWRSQRIISKKKHSSGTVMMTRSNTLIADISVKIQHMATKYRKVRERLTKLGGYLNDTAWEGVLKVLKDRHLRSLTTFDTGYGDGKRKLAWFWNVHCSGEDASVAVKNALRLEFCRARARAHRWQEECVLLAEEMRRTAQFFAHGSKTWLERAAQYEKMRQERLPPSADIAAFPTLVEDEHQQRIGAYGGKVAYARRQAAFKHQLREKCVRAHAHLLEPLRMMDMGGGKVLDGTIMVEGEGHKNKRKGKGKRK